MRTSFLLLFVFFYGVSSNAIDWSECGERALCRVHYTCNAAPKNTNLETWKHGNDDNRACSTGIKFKPETLQKWTVSIANGNDQQQDSKTLLWRIGNKDIVKCTATDAEFPEDDLKNKLSISVKNAASNFCEFTISTEGDGETISNILDEMKSKNGKQSSIGDVKKLPFVVYYDEVNSKIPCDTESLKTSDACDKTEDCIPREKLGWQCPDEYQSLFRKKKNENFTEVEVNCVEGKLKATHKVYTSDDPMEFIDESASKCARKKCRLCQAKDNFTSLFKSPSAKQWDECAKLKCEKGYMVINNNTIATAEPVQCATDIFIPEEDSSEILPEHARWVVNGESIVIDTAVCKDSVQCQNLFPLTPTKCESRNDSCFKPTINDVTSGAYGCKEGQTMHMDKQGTLIRIDPPHCDTNSSKVQWMVTMYLENNTTNTTGMTEGFIIECVENPKPVELTSDASTASFPWVWVVVPLVLGIIIIIAVAIGVLCFLKRKNNKKSAAVPPSKTSSSSSNTSSKPSSSASAEKEPLTSAMVSITAESLQTAREPVKPVVLAKADLRGTTQAASDTSTNKEEKSEKKEEKKIDPIPVKKEEKMEEKKQEKKVETKEVSVRHSKSDETDKRDLTDTKEKLTLMPKSVEDPLKSQTGGDGESQVESQNKNGESAKLLPRPTPRKYSRSSTKIAPKKPKNTTFLNVTDADEEEEPSKTGSMKRGRKRM